MDVEPVGGAAQRSAEPDVRAPRAGRQAADAATPSAGSRPGEAPLRSPAGPRVPDPAPEPGGRPADAPAPPESPQANSQLPDSAELRAPLAGDADETLDHLGRLCARLEHAEQRFKQMTDECGRVLEGLVSVDRRHATTLAALNERLGDWCDIERKLLEESARRIEQFERGVEHEWTALRRLHEEPIEDLKEQAEKMRIACLDAARMARLRLDAAEQAHALQTADLERRMADWSRRLLHAARGRAITDGETGVAAKTPGNGGAVEPWPLEGVAQLHHELRAGASPAQRTSSPGQSTENGRDNSPAARAADGDPAAPVSAGTPQAAPINRRTVWATAGGVVLLVVAVLTVYSFQVHRWLATLESRTQETVRTLEAKASPAQAPEPRVVEAQQVAQRAGTMVEILAAPDLRRYELTGVGPAQGAYAQVLWSRSRGMAISATRLPAPPPGRGYQVWVIADGTAASPGLLTPDATGSASLLLPGPLKLPRPLNISLTVEGAGGADRPTGPVYLIRVPAS